MISTISISSKYNLGAYQMVTIDVLATIMDGEDYATERENLLLECERLKSEAISRLYPDHNKPTAAPQPVAPQPKPMPQPHPVTPQPIQPVKNIVNPFK